jgi:hypothetical protein
MLNIHLPKTSKPRFAGSLAIVTGIILLTAGNNFIVGIVNAQNNSGDHSIANTIFPSEGVGVYKFGMSKHEVLKKLGKEFVAGNSISADGLIINIVDDKVKRIDVHSDVYKFANGLGIGNSDEEFKKTFGLDFKFEEDQGKLYLTYKELGLQFIIHKQKRTVMELSVTEVKLHNKKNALESLLLRR